jgi:hypothetical protein
MIIMRSILVFISFILLGVGAPLRAEYYAFNPIPSFDSDPDTQIFPAAINNNGVVVGFTNTTTYRPGVFRFVNGATELLSLPNGDKMAEAIAVNSGGTLIGYYSEFAYGMYADLGGPVIPMNPKIKSPAASMITAILSDWVKTGPYMARPAAG